jgi:hypothetical protein
MRRLEKWHAFPRYVSSQTGTNSPGMPKPIKPNEGKVFSKVNYLASSNILLEIFNKMYNITNCNLTFNNGLSIHNEKQFWQTKQNNYFLER